MIDEARHTDYCRLRIALVTDDAGKNAVMLFRHHSGCGPETEEIATWNADQLLAIVVARAASPQPTFTAWQIKWIADHKKRPTKRDIWNAALEIGRSSPPATEPAPAQPSAQLGMPSIQKEDTNV